LLPTAVLEDLIGDNNFNELEKDEFEDK